MTLDPILVGSLLAAAKSSSKSTSSSGSFTFILFLVVIGLAGYFLLLRPQQQRARRQRANQSEIAVGDEILTIGGIVGTVLELDAERVTIVTGAQFSEEAGEPGIAATRMVLVRNAVARKIEPKSEPSQDGLPEAELDFDSEGGEEEDGDDGSDDESEEGPAEGSASQPKARGGRASSSEDRLPEDGSEGDEGES